LERCSHMRGRSCLFLIVKAELAGCTAG